MQIEARTKGIYHNNIFIKGKKSFALFYYRFSNDEQQYLLSINSHPKKKSFS